MEKRWILKIVAIVPPFSFFCFAVCIIQYLLCGVKNIENILQRLRERPRKVIDTLLTPFGCICLLFSFLLRFSKETKKPENPFRIKDFQAFSFAEMERLSRHVSHGFTLPKHSPHVLLVAILLVLTFAFKFVYIKCFSIQLHALRQRRLQDKPLCPLHSCV